MRILYLGMMNDFSRIPLELLLKAGLDVCAVWVSGLDFAHSSESVFYDYPFRDERLRRSLLLDYDPLSAKKDVAFQAALDQRIPVEQLLWRFAPEQRLKKLNPDVVCVACFDKRIPQKLLSIPRHGFLNLHPSLLPDYRGPAPLFWQLRAGEPWTGVTVHWMDAALDTGDIAAQRRTPLPAGITGPELDRLLGTLGGELLVTVLTELEAGRVARRPQRPGGSYHSWPRAEDFRLDTGWPARRAYNFMRGTAEWMRPYPVWVDGKMLHLGSALAYSEEEHLSAPWEQVELEGTELEWMDGRVVRIQFTPGVLTAVLSYAQPHPGPPEPPGE